jgi:putative ABC transport system permease protein
MRLSDTVRWGTRGIRQRKLRAALTILGIMIGTAAVIALVSQTQGISTSINNQINQLGPNTILVTPASAAVLFTQIDVGRLSQIPGVSLVIPIIQSNIKVHGAQGVRSFSLVGVDPAQFGELVSNYKIDQGRLFQSLSYSEVTVGAYAYEPQDMTTPFLNIGQSVTIEFGLVKTSTKIISVAGSLQPYGMTLVSVDNSLFMSLQGVSSMLGRSSFTSIYLKTTDANSVDAVISNIKAYYGTNVNIISLKEITQVVSSITGLLSVLLGAIAGISLFVAAIGIANIMFVSVVERTREIGILKALGFKSRNVLAIFLSEAAMLGLIGGILGILLGSGLSYLIPILISSGFSSSSTIGGGATSGGFGGSSGFGSSGSTSFSYSPVISPEIVLLVFLFAIGVSLAAGYYPARRASKMDPVVALRAD